jgi:hypothetical protein
VANTSDESRRVIAATIRRVDDAVDAPRGEQNPLADGLGCPAHHADTELVAGLAG